MPKAAVNSDSAFDCEATLEWLNEMTPKEARTLVDRLTPRQREILVLACVGLPSGDTAAVMNLGKSTVATERMELLCRLGVRRLQIACIVACKAGLI